MYWIQWIPGFRGQVRNFKLAEAALEKRNPVSPRSASISSCDALSGPNQKSWMCEKWGGGSSRQQAAATDACLRKERRRRLEAKVK